VGHSMGDPFADALTLSVRVSFFVRHYTSVGMHEHKKSPKLLQCKEL
jgi:GTP-dependent phosphoenolpyruvate carboxykinase